MLTWPSGFIAGRPFLMSLSLIHIYRDWYILSFQRGNPLSQKKGASFGELIITNYDPRPCLLYTSCLRKQVNRLRCKEHPIASDRSGYFYATNAGEVYDRCV